MTSHIVSIYGGIRRGKKPSPGFSTLSFDTGRERPAGCLPNLGEAKFMKKKVSALFLALVLIFSLSVSASAITPRWDSTTTCNPRLLFSGTTASCRLTVVADSGSDIDATMTLYKGTGSSKSEIATWNVSDTTSMNVTKYATAKSGQKYTLEISVTVSGPNGTDYIDDSVTATCP